MAYSSTSTASASASPVDGTARVWVAREGTLHVRQWGVSDEGNYTCHAKNIYGTDVSKTLPIVNACMRAFAFLQSNLSLLD